MRPVWPGLLELGAVPVRSTDLEQFTLKQLEPTALLITYICRATRLPPHPGAIWLSSSLVWTQNGRRVTCRGNTVVAPCEGLIWLGNLSLLIPSGAADVDPYAQHTQFTVLESEPATAQVASVPWCSRGPVNGSLGRSSRTSWGEGVIVAIATARAMALLHRCCSLESFKPGAELGPLLHRKVFDCCLDLV